MEPDAGAGGHFRVLRPELRFLHAVRDDLLTLQTLLRFQPVDAGRSEFRDKIIEIWRFEQRFARLFLQ